MGATARSNASRAMFSTRSWLVDETVVHEWRSGSRSLRSGSSGPATRRSRRRSPPIPDGFCACAFPPSRSGPGARTSSAQQDMPKMAHWYSAQTGLIGYVRSSLGGPTLRREQRGAARTGGYRLPSTPRGSAAGNGPVQPECWFTTSPGGRWTWAAGEVFMEPVGVVHAKRMGTLTTACGLSATSWRKFWNAPFTRAWARGEVACERCSALIGAGASRPTASGSRGKPGESST